MFNEGSIKRTGGYVVVVLAALLLFAGWRAVGGETAGASNISMTATPATDEADTADTPAPILEAAQNVPVLTDNSLAPAPYPHTYQGQQPEHSFETYVVERGDTPIGIAEKFGIEPETILGGNPQLSHESSLLQTGVEIIILPIDGVLHDVQPGDSLESVAELYGIPAEEIIAYEPNRLEFPYRLYPETQIMVPGAVRELFVWTPPSLETVRGAGGGVRPLVVGTGSFIFPVNSRNYTQFFWAGHPGLDIGLGEGTAVYAADTGTVTYAGWNVYGYGNVVVVNHGNGYETLYAHLSGYNVGPGQIVTKGQVIGSSGNTGASSGPHLHFEIRINGNRDDPCWYIGC
jgi:LysM repeat protein